MTSPTKKIWRHQEVAARWHPQHIYLRDRKVGGGTRKYRASGCNDRGFLGSKIPENMTTPTEKNMTSLPGNCGAVAPLTYISKRKKLGVEPEKNRMSGCSDRGFLGSKMPENMTSLWRHRKISERSRNVPGGACVGDGTRKNRMSGCSDRGFLGSKMPENTTPLWRHRELSERSRNVPGGTLLSL